MAIKPSNTIDKTSKANDEPFTSTLQALNTANAKTMKSAFTSMSQSYEQMLNGNVNVNVTSKGISFTDSEIKKATFDIKNELFKDASQQCKNQRDFVIDKCYEVYKKRINKGKCDITLAAKEMTHYFAGNSNEKNLRCLLTFRPKLFKIMKSFKDQLQEIQNLKMLFKGKSEDLIIERSIGRDEGMIRRKCECGKENKGKCISQSQSQSLNGSQKISNGGDTNNNDEIEEGIDSDEIEEIGNITEENEGEGEGQIEGETNTGNDNGKQEDNGISEGDNDERRLIQLQQQQHQLQQQAMIQKDKQFNELNKILRAAILRLTDLYNAFIESSSDIETLFKVPLKLLASSSSSKDSIDFSKIHKEEFCTVIFNDDLLKSIITHIYDKGPQYAWVNEIIKVVKTGYEQENKESARMEKKIQQELNKTSQPNTMQSSPITTTKPASNDNASNGNDIPIDDLVKYINESPKSQPKSKKGKKKGSKQKAPCSPNQSSSLSSSTTLSSSSSLFISNQTQKEKNEADAEIASLKTSLKDNSFQAYTRHKIKACYTKEWLEALSKYNKD